MCQTDTLGDQPDCRLGGLSGVLSPFNLLTKNISDTTLRQNKTRASGIGFNFHPQPGNSRVNGAIKNRVVTQRGEKLFPRSHLERMTGKCDQKIKLPRREPDVDIVRGKKTSAE